MIIFHMIGHAKVSYAMEMTMVDQDVAPSSITSPFPFNDFSKNQDKQNHD